MNINTIDAAGISQLSYSQSQNTSTQSSFEVSKETPTKPVSIWRDLAEKYDVRSITPQETADLSAELYDAGVISFLDHAILSFQPELGKIQLPDGASINLTHADGNGRRDLTAEYEARIEFSKKHGHNSEYNAGRERILEYLNRLDAAKGKPIEIVV